MLISRKTKLRIRWPRKVSFTRRLFLLAIFVVAQLIFFTSSTFRVQAIEVTGNSHVRDGIIRAQASVPLDANLFSVPLRAVEGRVKALHWVRDVAVRRYVPGRIQIRIRERTPVLAVADDRLEGDFPAHWFVVSDDGVILSRARLRGDEKLPRVYVRGPLVVGRKLHADIVAAVRKLLGALPASVASMMLGLRADNEGQLYLTIGLLERPVEVRLGVLDRPALEFQVLQALVEQLRAEGRPVTYIDLRFTNPAVGHGADVQSNLGIE